MWPGLCNSKGGWRRGVKLKELCLSVCESKGYLSHEKRCSNQSIQPQNHHK